MVRHMSNTSGNEKPRWARFTEIALLGMVNIAAGCILKISFDGASHIEAIQTKVNDTAATVAVMYRASDAARDVAEITRRIDTNEKRISVLDARIDDVQKRVRYVEEHPTTAVHRP